MVLCAINGFPAESIAVESVLKIESQNSENQLNFNCIIAAYDF